MSQHMPPNPPEWRADETAIAVTFGGPVAPGDVTRACDCLRSRVRAAAATVVICDVSGLAPIDAGTVNLIARLALAARRGRCRVLLAGASSDLLALVELCGLAGVVPTSDDQASSRDGSPNSGKYFAVSRKNVIPLILPSDISTT
jgi:ABC-type transporter Mla MlaB component